MTDPTPGSASYGDVNGVAALTPRYCNTSTPPTFDSTTRPTITEVVLLIDQVSSLINLVLSREGFQIPVVQPLCTPMLAMFCESEVASIAEGINGSGRFGPIKTGTQKSRFSLLAVDIQDYITTNAVGFERLGAVRLYTPAYGIGFRDHNRAGDPTFPIFERDAFGKDSFFDDWDSISGSSRRPDDNH
jgi:hypothetical protein